MRILLTREFCAITIVGGTGSVSSVSEIVQVIATDIPQEVENTEDVAIYDMIDNIPEEDEIIKYSSNTSDFVIDVNKKTYYLDLLTRLSLKI